MAQGTDEVCNGKSRGAWPAICYVDMANGRGRSEKKAKSAAALWCVALPRVTFAV